MAYEKVGRAGYEGGKELGGGGRGREGREEERGRIMRAKEMEKREGEGKAIAEKRDGLEM